MQKKPFYFEVSGEIKLTDVVSPLTSEGLTDKFNADREFINEEINLATSREITKLLKSRVKVNVNLIFENGSVLFWGLAAMDYIGQIAGVMTFLDYCGRFIKWTVKRVIERRLTDIFQVDYPVEVNVTLVPDYADPLPEEGSGSSINIFKISPSKLLIYITLINITLFLGGTLFNAIEIPNVLKRYEEANNKFSEAEQKVKTAELAYYNNQAEMDHLKNEVIQKKTEIIHSLTSDTTGFGQQIDSISKKISAANVSLIALERANNDIKIRQVGFKVIWSYMDSGLRCLTIILFTCAILSVLASVFLFFLGTGRP